MSKILSIIASDGYQDVEYLDSKKALEDHGHTVITASTTNEAKGKLGGTVKVDILLKDVNPDDYNAVMFIGGPGSYQYMDDPLAHVIAKAFFAAGKITAAICAAPSILANAGILNGKTVTSHPCEADNIKTKGITHTGKSVEVDLPIITADGPDSAKKFGETIAKALA